MAELPKPVRIAVDVMGGDLGPRPIVLACSQFLKDHPNVELILVGDPGLITPLLPNPCSRLRILTALQAVSMNDKPFQALRKRTQSSMHLALQELGSARADACISTGNTGALVAFAIKCLGLLPGIDRPAICKAIPSQKGVCWVLDLGANVECTPEQLKQNALMGAALAIQQGQINPRIGLLNIGHELYKGRALEQATYPLLQAIPGIHFQGFIEASEVFKGNADVLVCDGFSGNVMLKASEGAAVYMRHIFKQFLQQSILFKVLSFLAADRFKKYFSQYDPAQLNGAYLLGLKGLVIKSHGSSSEQAFYAALSVAYEQIKTDFLQAYSASLNAFKST